MNARVLALLRARLSGANRGTDLPIAPLVMHGLIAGVLCGLARGALPPFAYGVFALSITGALVAIPLLGELAYLLRADPAQEWVAALPASPFDLRLARMLHILIALAWLATGSLLPAAIFAPGALGVAGRVLLLLGGLGLVTCVGAFLLLLQSALSNRAEALLVLFQTALVIGVVVGFVMGLRLVPWLTGFDAFGAASAEWTWLYPPAWFAAPLGTDVAWAAALPVAAALVALGVLVLTPPAAAARRGRREPLLAFLLRPARALATRFWVRADERAAFDFVYDALPLEREVVLRTYPMVGIPLAFLVASTVGEPGSTRGDLLAVLLFTACIYLPILLVHVPASESHRASWILTTQPLSENVLAAGAIKALAVRFLFPLYVVLSLLAWSQAGVELVLRLALPGFLISLLVTRGLYKTCVSEPPLSVPPDEVRADYDWGGPFLGIALVLTIGAVLASRFLPTIGHGAVLAGVLIAAELVAERKLRRGVAPVSGGA